MKSKRSFKNGTHLNYVRKGICKTKYIRTSAGPQRGEYVHKMIWLAYQEGALSQMREGPRRVELRQLISEVKHGIKTIDHVDGNSLNNHWTNLEAVTWEENTRRVREREHYERLQRCNVK